MTRAPRALSRLTAVTAMVALISHSSAPLAQRAFEPLAPNLTTEGSAAERALPVLNTYRDRLATARQSRTPLTSAQLADLKAAATASKEQYAALQRAASSLMAKLKTAGKWNVDLDKEVERRMMAANISGEFVNYVRSLGGPRALIENSATMVTDSAKEMDADIAALTKRSPAQAALDAILGVPVFAACVKCHCTWYAVGATVALLSGIGTGAALGMAVGGLACVSAAR